MTLPSPGCWAAHSALYLEPTGRVSACCATGFSVGQIGGPIGDTLTGIWRGAGLAAQRRALEAGSFDYGCQECEIPIRAGQRDASLAVHFDRFADGAPHPYPRLLDLALSNRCNLQCVMCNGGLSSAIRAQREGLPPLPNPYDDAFFTELRTFLPHAERIQFKGGEPFLARENRIVWDHLLADGLRPQITITTNGTVFDERVEHYLRELRMEPNVSIDGMAPTTLEAIRVGTHAPDVWRNVDRIQATAEAADRRLTLSFCLMRENWREALDLVHEADQRGAYAYLIFVNQPERHDLLTLPRHDLRAILDHLEALPVDLRITENAAQWHATLTRIRTHLEAPVTLRVAAPNDPIPPATPDRPGLVEAEQRDLRATLRQLGGVEPLALIARGGQIVEVEPTPWATWLQPERWRDTSLLDLAPTIERTTDRPLTSHPVACEIDGVHRLAISIGDEHGRDELWVHLAHRRVEGDVLVYVIPRPTSPG